MMKNNNTHPRRFSLLGKDRLKWRRLFGSLISLLMIGFATTAMRPMPAPVSALTAAESIDLIQLDLDEDLSIDAGEQAQIFAAAACGTTANDLGGTIWRDFDSDGVLDANERGFADVTVTAFDNNGLVSTTPVNADGTYNFDDIFNGRTGDDAHIRLEFSGLPDWVQSGVHGTNSDTTVQRHAVATCAADLAVQNPADYCDSNPLVATACYIDGDQSTAGDVLVALNYDASGAVQHVATANQIGSTWGLAFQSSTRTLFAAAVLKRHTGFGPGQDGTIGTADDISAIYVIDYSNPGINGEGTVNTGRTIDLSDFGIDVGADPRLTSTPTNDLSLAGGESRDYDVHDNIGRLGIGGMHLSDDSQTLYLVNLNTAQPQLVALNVSDLDNITLASAVNIPNPGCPGSDTYAPWGVHVRDGNVYVGTVCTADNSANAANLRAYVQQLSGNTIVNLDLDSTTANDYIQLYYDRGCRFFYTPDARCLAAEWREWNTAWNVHNQTGPAVHTTQPILSDLAFGTDGSLTLGLMDRTGHQRGFQNLQPDTGDPTLYNYLGGGDLLKLCLVNGVFVPEGGAGCAQSFSNDYDKSTANDLAPGAAGIPDEFYNDNTVATGVIDQHGESFIGGLAQMPTTDQFVATYLDPAGGYNNSGYRWHDQSDGSHFRNYELYSTAVPANDPNTFSKSNGLGDVALLCAPAPLEIGNYVWLDEDKDGIQDPCEEPFANVDVVLTDSTGNTYTTTTSPTGEYYFNAANVTGGLVPSSTYTLTIDMTQAALNGYELTVTDANSGSTLPDGVDSDASKIGDLAVINLTTGHAGENDHTFDFGFTPPSLQIGNQVWYDANDNGVIDGFESGYGIDGVTVELLDSTGAVISMTTTADGGFYLFKADAAGNPLLDGDYQVRIPAFANMGGAGSALPLDDWRSSTDTANAADPNSDINSDDNGAGITNNADITSGVISATVGTEPETAVDGDDANGNLTVDFGFYDACTVADGDLGGNIFRDFDSDGVLAANEPGWTDAVTVTAYDNDGNATTTTINPDGSYDFDGIFPNPVTDADHIRLEFSGLPAWAESGVGGANSGTTVQIHKAATCEADLAVQNPADYCQENPLLYTTCYIDNGASDYSGAFAAGVAIPYDASGDSPAKSYMVPDSDVGATWGVAYHQPSGKLFVASYVKVRTTLGPEGSTGTIYEISTNGATSAIGTPFVDLNAEGFNTGDNPHPDPADSCISGEVGGPSNFACLVHDIDPDSDISEVTAARVGQWGLGDIDFTDDFSKMFAVDLKDKSLIEIPVDSNANRNGTIVEHDLSAMFGDCANNDWQPFGLSNRDGQMYLGVVCTGRTSKDIANLDAILYSFDPATPATLTQVFQFDLDYSRDGKIRACSNFDVGQGFADPCTSEWRYWTETYDDLPTPTSPLKAYQRNNGTKIEVISPQPIFSDIEFDGDYLYIGLRDRAPDQYGNDIGNPYELSDGREWSAVSAGDILCAHFDGTKYVLENNGKCGDRTNTVNTANQGPGGGEFFIDGNQTLHEEEFLGGLAIRPKSGEIVFTSMNPTVSFSSAGIATSSLENGVQNSGARIYERNDGPNFSKASGLGDLELLCAPAPLEIGNYVWLDEDKDGIQDPCEEPLANVDVVLTDSTGNTYTTTTSPTGEYYFNAANVTGGLVPSSTYTLTIDMTQPELDNLGVTVTDANSGTTLPDGVDSDAKKVGETAVINLVTGKAGQNDHTLDFGFTQVVEIGNQVWIESDKDGLAATGTITPVVGIVVTATGSNGTVYTATTDATGFYTITVPADATYTVTMEAPAGFNVSVPAGGLIGTDNDPNGDNQTSHNPAGTVVTVGTENNYTIDFGFHEIVEIGNQVWIESDSDGLAATGTITPVVGVVVTAIGSDGIVYTATTDVTGFYTIPVPTNDAYTVTVMAPAGTDVSVPAAGLIGADNDPNSNNQTSHNPAGTVVTVGTDNNYTIDFGFHEVVEIGNQVWIESDSDGLAATGTITPVIGSVVTAVGSDGTIYTATTDATGFYTITVPANATYTVTVMTPADHDISVPAGGLVGTDNDPNSNNQTSHDNGGTIVTVGTENNYTIDFGFHKTVEIGNQLWIESDKDGLAATGTITPVVGSVVTAVSSGGAIYSATTDVTGFYTITVPANDAYTVTVDAPAGYEISVPAGGLVATDNDPNGNNQTSHDNSGTVVTVAEENNYTIDFGFHPVVEIGNQVWIESDNDGLATTGTITPVVGSVVTAVSPDGTIYTATTDATGFYTITVLANQDYTVTVAAPAGTDISVPAGGLIDTDNDPNSNNQTSHNNRGTVVSVGTENNYTIDFGFHEVVEIGNQVWIESDSDGLATTGTITPVVGSVVTAVGSDGKIYTATTDATGFYTITVPANAAYTVTVMAPAGHNISVPAGGLVGTDNDPNSNNQTSHDNGGTVVTVGTEDNYTIDFGFHETVEIGNQVWIESDDDGIATTGTITPVVGSVVTAISSNGMIYTATTDATGFYTITVPANDAYTLTVGTPAGFAQSVPAGGLIGTDNDPATNNQTSHDSAGTVVTVGTADNYTIDFGFHDVVEIGNQVWIESDSDGLAATGTITPVVGAVVTAVSPDGTIYTATTDATGFYTITVLANQDYTVTVAAPAGTDISVPAGGLIGTDNDPNGNNQTSHNNRGTVVSVGTENNYTIDFGFHEVVEIGNQVWIESDSDGDATTGTITPVSGSVVTAIGPDGRVYTATTDLTGFYTISVPANAAYTITVMAPAGTVISVPAGGLIGTDNDPNGDNQMSHDHTGTVVTVGEENNYTIDFGFHETVEIGNQVLIESDSDGDGATGTTTPVTGTVVTAVSSDGTVYTGTTDATGFYTITVPANDAYTVTVGTPADTVVSVPTGGLLVADNDPNTGNEIAHDPAGTVVTVDTNDNYTIDFIFHETVEIGNQIWAEDDNDGDATTGTITPILGVVVTATSTNGTVYTATTDANGFYTLTVPANDTYNLTVTPPNGLTVSVPAGGPITADSDPNSNDQLSHAPSGTTVTVGTDDNYTIDFGFHSTIEIGNQVWTEDDRDGDATTGTITPIPDVVVTAVSSSGQIFTATTDASGFYTLTVLPNDSYTVTVMVPDGFGISVPAGGLITADNDPNSGNQLSHDPAGTVVTADDMDNYTIDFGFHPTVEIGNQVWIEDDNDGDATTGTITPVASAVVTATAADGTVYTGTTDAGGFYTITVPANAVYTVTVGTPADAAPSAPDGGLIGTDSDPTSENSLSHNPSGTVVTVGTDDNYTIDFGFFKPVAIGNTIWIDSGEGGGGRNNGLIDGTEQGVANVVVELYKDGDVPGTSTPVFTTTTDVDGHYLFDMIPEGDYVVHIPAAEFSIGKPLGGYVSSTGNGGDDATDDGSNENGQDDLAPYSNGISSTVIELRAGDEPVGETGAGGYTGTLADDRVNMTVDFGFVELLTLGNQIWFDDNDNGQLDSTESSVGAGVVLYLLDGDGSAVPHPVTGQPITTTTSADGKYLFTNLYPGDYRVQIGPENFEIGAQLEGYASSTGSSDPDNDSDSDDNGGDTDDVLGQGITSDPVTLDYDSEPANGSDSDDNDHTNLSVDFGLVLIPTAVELISFTAQRLGHDNIEIRWETGSEIDNFGFRLMRSADGTFANAIQVHFQVSPVTTGPGAAYRHLDRNVAPGTYTYWLIDVETTGTEKAHGPVTVTLTQDFQIYLPVISNR